MPYYACRKTRTLPMPSWSVLRPDHTQTAMHDDAASPCAASGRHSTPQTSALALIEVARTLVRSCYAATLRNRIQACTMDQSAITYHFQKRQQGYFLVAAQTTRMPPAALQHRCTTPAPHFREKFKAPPTMWKRMLLPQQHPVRRHNTCY